MLQDMVLPYRHGDDELLFGLNACLRELTRLRPDIFLDLKYQAPLRKGDTGNGSDDVTFALDPTTGLAPAQGTTADYLIPIPPSYQQLMVWGGTGYVQFLDVTDTQDQRAQGFLTKFNSHLLTLTAG
jgi:hypothetical protein